MEQSGERTTKIPYNPMTGNRGKSNDPSTFTSFDNALQRVGQYTGLGIGIFNGICAIDLDHCVSDSGFFNEIATQVVELMHSYTEYSPSGHGLRILFEAKGFQYDKQTYYTMHHQKGLEAYVAGATSKYVTVTGNRVNNYPFGERSKELTELLERFMRRESDRERSDSEKQVVPLGRNAINGVNSFNGSNALLSDETLLNKSMSCRNGQCFERLWKGDCSGYSSQSEADIALCGYLAFWTGRNADQMDRLFRQSGLMRDKLKKNNVREIKRSELLRMCRGKFFKKVEDIVPTLELLDSHHYIRLEEPIRMTAGRPPDWRVLVNPVAYREVVA